MEAEIQSFLGVVLFAMLAGMLVFGICVIVVGLFFEASKWSRGKVFLEVTDYNKPSSSIWEGEGKVRVVHQIGIIKSTVWGMGFGSGDNDRDKTILHAKVIFNIYKHILRNRIRGAVIGKDMDITNTSIFQNKTFVGRVYHNDDRSLTHRANEVIDGFKTCKNKKTKIVLDKEYINNK